MRQQSSKHSRIKSTLFSAAFWGFALSTASTQAITFGELDGDAHPNVGAILRDYPDLGFVPACSGTLIHPRVLLTAGHCSTYVEAHPEEEFFVSFDADNVLDPATWIRVVGAETHPEINTRHAAADSHQNDIGVLILEGPVEGIEPASLPPLHYLDTLKREKKLNPDTLLTVVGYGSILILPPPEVVYLDGPRRTTQSRYLALDPSFLFLLQNPAAGYAGTGYGDSGGPTFYTDSNGNEILVSLTSVGDPNLVAFGASFRVDTLSAQAFLASVLASIE